MFLRDAPLLLRRDLRAVLVSFSGGRVLALVKASAKFTAYVSELHSDAA